MSTDDATNEFFDELSDEQWLRRVADSENGTETTVGDYDLVREVARGGQGVVFQGRHRASGEKVAVKRPLAGARATDQQRERLRREMELVQKLDHDGIVRLREVVETDEGVTAVFEWIDGLPADVWAAELPREDRVPTILRTFVSTCRAVQFAHDHGVVHRDLKPGNLLVDRAHRPHVLDFGIALADEESRITNTGDFLGTPRYSSPEQLASGAHAADSRSDVYSLGAILYQQLTGELPDRRKGVRAPTMIAGDLPVGLDAVLLQALDDDPIERYQSVSELADDAARVLRGEAPLANPNSVTRKVRRVLRRHRVPVVLGLLLVTTAAALGSGWLQQAEAANQQAEQAKEKRGKVVLAFAELMASGKTDAFGNPLPVSTVLSHMQEAADKLWPDAPFEHANLLQLLAERQLESDRAELALATAERAMQVWQDLREPARIVVARILRLKALMRSGKRSDASGEIDDVLESARALGPSGSALLVDAMNVAIPIHLSTQSLDRVTELQQERAALTAASIGDPEWLRDQIDTFQLLRWAGLSQVAAEHCMELVSTCEQLPTPNPSAVASAKFVLGLALIDANYSQALRAFEESLAIREQLQSSPPELAECLAYAGQLHAKNPKMAEQAVEELDRALALMVGQFDVHGVVDLAYRGKANALISLQRWAEALVAIDRGLAHSIKNRGDDHMSVGYMQLTRSAVLKELKRFDEAYAAIDEAEGIFSQWLGAEHRELGQMHHNRLAVAQAEGDVDGIRKHSDAQLEHMRNAPDAGRWYAFACGDCASARFWIKDYDVALSICDEGFAYLRENPELVEPRLLMPLYKYWANARFRQIEAAIDAGEPGSWAAELDVVLKRFELCTPPKKMPGVRSEIDAVKAKIK